MFKKLVSIAAVAQAVTLKNKYEDLFSDDESAIKQSLASIKKAEKDVHGTFTHLS